MSKGKGTGDKGGDKAAAEGKAPESGNSLVATDALPDGSIAITRHGEAEIGDGLFTDEASPTVEELTDTGEFETEGEDSAGKGGKDEGDGEIKDSLFEEEGEEGGSPADDKSKAAGKEGEGEKPEAKGKDKGGEGEEDKGEGEGKGDEGGGDKPPPGFVSQAALHQMRQKFYVMRDQTEELRRENEALRRGVAGTGREGKGEAEEKEEGDPLSDALGSFTKKVSDLNLTEKEIQEDPVGASTRMAKLLKEDLPKLLGDVATGIATQVSSKTEADQSQRDFQDTVNRGITLMEKLVPGITDSEGSDVNRRLSDFAVKNGLDKETLRAMTHPGTIIYPPDGEPRYVEDGAAYFTLFLKNAYDRSGSNGEITDDVREKIKAEIEPALREQIRKEEVEKVMQKLKTGKAEGKEFSSLGDIAGGAGEAEEEFLLNSETALTEAQFAKLSPGQKRKYLGGF